MTLEDHWNHRTCSTAGSCDGSNDSPSHCDIRDPGCPWGTSDAGWEAVGSWEEIVGDDLRPVLFGRMILYTLWSTLRDLVHALNFGIRLAKCGSCFHFLSMQVTDGSGRLGNNLAFILRSWAANNLNRLGSGNIRYHWMIFLHFVQHFIGILFFPTDSEVEFSMHR